MARSRDTNVSLSERHVARLGGPAPPGRGRFDLLVPGAEAPVYPLDLPARVTGAARLGIARRQLVDRIGGVAERLELHPLGGGAWTRVCAVDPEGAAQWRADPLARDRRCAGMVPDYFALPWGEDVAVLRAEGGSVRVRHGQTEGFTVPAALAAPALRLLLEARAPVAALTVGAMPRGAHDVLQRAGVTQVDDPAALAGLGGGAFRAVAPGEGPLDLRRDPAAGGARLAGTLARWSVPAVAAGLAAAIFAVDLARETAALQRAASAARAETEAMLRRGLIPSGPILDVRAQVARAMAGQGAGSGVPNPLDVLRRAGAEIVAAGAEVERVTLDPREVAFALSVADFAGIDTLVAALDAAGLEAGADRPRSAEGGGVVATLRVAATGEAP